MSRFTIFSKKVEESLGNRFEETDKTLLTNYITDSKTMKKLFRFELKR